MSAGHRHEYLHHPDVVAEVERLLDAPNIQSYLGRPYRTIRGVRVPLTGGSSLDGAMYYIDPSVPPRYVPFVLWHERVEKAFRTVFRMSYSRAHTLATAAERIMVEKAGMDWSRYKRILAAIVREDEQQTPHKMPDGFDYEPYKESGMMHLVQT